MVQDGNVLANNYLANVDGSVDRRSALRKDPPTVTAKPWAVGHDPASHPLPGRGRGTPNAVKPSAVFWTPLSTAGGLSAFGVHDEEREQMSRFTAVIVNTADEDGKVLVRKVQVDGDSGRFFNQQVGGYFEHLYSEDRKTDFWMAEEGKLRGDPINVVATEILYDLHPAFQGQDILVGNVVLTGNRGPNTGNVPAATWKRVQEIEYAAAARAGLTIEFVDDAVVVNA